jgi:hypothetical protein
MPLFRKKPVMIEAVRFVGIDVAENGRHGMHFETEGTLPKWLQAALMDDTIFAAITDVDFIYIKTREGIMEVALGDWIIRGVKGELYPCKPDIFNLTYDPVDEQDVEITGAAI